MRTIWPTALRAPVSGVKKVSMERGCHEGAWTLAASSLPLANCVLLRSAERQQTILPKALGMVNGAECPRCAN